MTAEDNSRKRKRPAKSCEQCRQRKVRCDRNIPCGPCSRARSSLHCSYREASLPPSPPRFSQSAPDLHRPTSNHPTPTSLEDTSILINPDRCQPESSLVHPSSPAQPPFPDIQHRLRCVEERLVNYETNPKAPVDDRHLDQALRELTEKVHGIEHQLVASANSVETQEEEGLSVIGIPPRLHISATKTKLLSPTHWVHAVDQLQIDSPFTTRESEPSFKDLKADLTSLLKECRSLRQSIKSQHSVRLNDPIPDLHGSIPPKPICDKLVEGYLRTFELIYRIVHVPSFWKEYEQFWEQPKLTSSCFLMKLVLVLTIGVTFYPDRSGPIHDRFTHLTQTWIFAAQWWLAGPSEKSTINTDGLQVFCLLLIARKLGPLGPSPCLSTGSLAEISMRLGLHRDPKNFPSLSAFQTEMRVRLGATVLELTLQSSLESGVPFSLPQYFDTSAPSNINDQDIMPNTSTLPPSKPSGQFTDASIQILLHESLKLRMKVIQYVIDPGRKSYQQALRLGREMRNVCRRIAAFFQSIPRQSSQGLEPTDFHKKFLDMQMRRHILALHSHFMVQARKDPQYYYSRKACLESAMVIASYTSDLSVPFHALDDLSRLTLVGRGAFKCSLGLDIISVLGLEIITQLEEAGSAHPVSDPLDELTKANRSPLIQSLEHILDQLRHIIRLGSPSMKRYNFLTAMLGQVRAMESNQCVKRAIYETVLQSLRECYALLQASMAGTSHGLNQELLNIAIVPAVLSPPDPSLSPLSIESNDPMFDLDFSSLLCFTTMDDLGSDDV